MNQLVALLILLTVSSTLGFCSFTRTFTKSFTSVPLQNCTPSSEVCPSEPLRWTPFCKWTYTSLLNDMPHRYTTLYLTQVRCTCCSKTMQYHFFKTNHFITFYVYAHFIILTITINHSQIQPPIGNCSPCTSSVRFSRSRACKTCCKGVTPKQVTGGTVTSERCEQLMV